MNLNKIKKDSTPEINKKFKKSKFDLLTNENDFFFKNFLDLKICSTKYKINSVFSM